MNRTQFTIFLLILVLVIAISYITTQEFRKYKNKIYNQGIQDAAKILSNQIIFDALQCKVISLNYLDDNNQTQQINLIAIECLQQNNLKGGN